MKIRVTAGKGAKDRETLLSETALRILREYFGQFKPKEWLFPGEERGNHLTERSAERVFKDSLKKAGLIKPATFHTLRHSFATHLLEDGVDKRYIQELLGHGNIRTTERYTRVNQNALGRIKNPLDGLLLVRSNNEHILVKGLFPATGLREAYQISMLPAMRGATSLAKHPCLPRGCNRRKVYGL